MPPIDLQVVAQHVCQSHQYTFVQCVGGGSFKETFHVQNPQNNSVALKVYRPGTSRERSVREIEAITRCNHPNIGRLFSVTTVNFGGDDYLVSFEEFLSGGTLSQRVQRTGLLSPEETKQIGSYLIDAVAHIASLGLVHRDFKPDNILFRNDGTTPVIVDFGLVRDLSDSSLTQSWLARGPGTPFFASPEQLNNEKMLIDWRTDQFCLGILLIYCALGFHPFQLAGEMPGEIVDRVARRENASPQFLTAPLADRIPALVKMTRLWPVQRYRLPEELQIAWEAQGGTS